MTLPPVSKPLSEHCGLMKFDEENSINYRLHLVNGKLLLVSPGIIAYDPAIIKLNLAVKQSIQVNEKEQIETVENDVYSIYSKSTVTFGPIHARTEVEIKRNGELIMKLMEGQVSIASYLKGNNCVQTDEQLIVIDNHDFTGINLALLSNHLEYVITDDERLSNLLIFSKLAKPQYKDRAEWRELKDDTLTVSEGEALRSIVWEATIADEEGDITVMETCIPGYRKGYSVNAGDVVYSRCEGNQEPQIHVSVNDVHIN